MLDLNINLDTRNSRRLRTLALASRKLAAQSLTFTAERAVPAWRAGNAVFHRRNAWLDKGVRLRAATASNLTARVGTVDKFFGRHVKGLGEDKQGRLFIPFYARISDVPTHRRLRASLKRMWGTKRGKPFRIGNTLFRHDPRRKSGKLIVLGFIRNGADVPDRFDAGGIVDRVVQREFPTVYERLLLKWAGAPS